MKIALGLVLAVGASAAWASAPGEQQAEGATPQVEKLLQNCDAHKFETVVDSVVDGQPKKSRVKLCGQEGQSDADWIGTLKDAIAKLDDNKDMAAPVRAQIVNAINAEIARLQMMADLGAPKVREPVAQAATTPSLSGDYSALPPIPTAPSPPKAIAGAVTTPVASVPTPMPAVSTASIAAPALRRPAPKLSFACYSPGDLGGDAPCSGFDRDTMLTIRAGSDVPAGVALNFLRNGDARGSVDLAQLRKGKSLRVALPRDVCEGFGAGRLELQVVQDGAPVNTDGPYSLRC